MAVPASPAEGKTPAPACSNSEQLEVESCTVSRWRGYMSSTFVASLRDGTPVAESAGFRWRGQAAPPDAGRARRAYDELRAELQRLGWEDTDERSDAWYAGRFTRPLGVPVDSAPAEAAPAAVEPEHRRLREAPVPLAAPPRAEPPVESAPQPLHVALEVPLEAAPMLPATQRVAEVQAAEAPRRRRIAIVVGVLILVGVLGIAAAIAVAAYLAFGSSGRHGLRSQAAPVSAAVPPAVSAAKPAHTVAAPAPLPTVAVAVAPTVANVRLDISAHTRSSWFEVRHGSATGKVLFTGELAPGRTLHLKGQRLWARFGAARNLTITADGRPVELTGTLEHVFSAAKR